MKYKIVYKKNWDNLSTIKSIMTDIKLYIICRKMNRHADSIFPHVTILDIIYKRRIAQIIRDKTV